MEERTFFCVIMPKILIVSIPPLHALLDQASGSALIPSDQQKYSENPIIPLKLRFGCQFPSRLEGFISLDGPNPFRAEPAPRSLGTGWVFQGKGRILVNLRAASMQ